MRQGEAVFVDSGAWIALALARDPLHAQAQEQWELLHEVGAELHTPFPLSSRHSHFLIAMLTETRRLFTLSFKHRRQGRQSVHCSACLFWVHEPRAVLAARPTDIPISTRPWIWSGPSSVRPIPARPSMPVRYPLPAMPLQLIRHAHKFHGPSQPRHYTPQMRVVSHCSCAPLLHAALNVPEPRGLCVKFGG